MTELLKLGSSVSRAGKPNLSWINASHSTKWKGKHLLGRVHAIHVRLFNYAYFMLAPWLPVVCYWFFFLFHSVTQNFMLFIGTKIIPDRASIHTQNSDFGAITVTERSWAEHIPKVEPLCVILWCSVNTYSGRRGSEGARTGNHWNGSKFIQMRIWI